MGRELRRWLLILMLLLGLGAAIVLSEAPTGSLAGQIQFPSDTAAATARVIASGPVVRGVYADEVGQYQLHDLPVGTYRIQAMAPGFQRTRLEETFRIEEGQILQLPQIELERLRPTLNLYGTSQVYTTAEPPQAQLSSSGLEQVQIEIYGLSLTDYLGTPTLADLADPYGYGLELPPQIGQAGPIEAWEQTIPTANEDGWSALTLDLPQLSPGAYWIRARGGREGEDQLQQTAWFLISDLGLVQKRAPDQLVIEAVDLNTLQPLPGIDLQIFDPAAPQQPWISVTTGADGLAQVAIPAAQQATRQWVIYGQGGSDRHRALSQVNFYGYRDTRFFTYTDRPLYRPGQTVYFRSIIRQIDPQRGPVPLDQTPVQVRVTTPRGDPILEQRLILSEFGTLHGQVELPLEGDLGSYEIELITASGESRSQYFSVEEYRKPEFEVTVTPEQPWIRQGESAQVEVRAEYLFGGPVAGAEVHYIVYRSSDWGYRYGLLPRSPQETFFAGELNADRYGDYGGYGEVVLEGDGVTDGAGVAQLQLENLLADFDWQTDRYFGETPVQQLRIEVEVTDISRRSVTQDGRLRVTQGDLALFLTGDRYVAQPGETIRYQVQSLGYDGQPRSTSGELRLERWQWDRDQQDYRQRQTITTAPFQTQAGEGEATLTLPTDLPTGDYRILAVTRDQQRQPIQEARSLWVMNRQGGDRHRNWGRGRGRSAGLELTPDRQVYQVGDTAQVVIASPLSDAHALITLEGSTLYEAKVQQLQGSVALVEVPILESYQPNVYFSVTLVGPDRQVYQRQVPLWVSPLDRFLTVEIEPDRTRYQPGETAQILLKTRDADGQPIAAEVSLGAVDEGIYLLRPDPTPDIRRFFYRRRYNQVDTSTSFPQQYPGGLDKLAQRLRQTFEDTAAWFPTVITDAQGEARVQIPLPDTLTTWRLTAIATTPDTQVGSAVNRIQVSKDLLVRLATPRFFSTGDRLQLTAVIQNQTDRPLVTDVELETSSVLVPEGERRRQIQLAPQAAQRVEWTTSVVTAGEAIVRVAATAGDLQDRVQLTIPAQAYGARYQVGERGWLEGESQTAQIDLTVPEDLVPGSLDWQIQLATHPVADLLGGVDYLVDYPYGCTEQTLSRFLPSLAVAVAAETLGLPLRSETLTRLPKTIDQGLRRLSQLQNSDGGWGWWQFDSSNPDLTSYVLLGYYRAENAGYGVDPDQEERGIQFLEQWMAQSEPQDPDSQMIAAYALSLFGRADLEQVQGVNSTQLSTLGQAYRTLALLRLGDRASAQAALLDLLRQVNREGRLIWYQAPDPSSQQVSPWHRHHYQDVEIAGPVLAAATALESPRADPIAEWISDLRQGTRWSTTKATADAIVGLTQYYQAKATKTPANYEVILRNSTTGALLGRWSPDWDRPYQIIDLSPRDLGSALLQPGSQTLAIEKQGSGPLHYSLSLQGTIATPPDRPMASQSQGLSIRRQYFSLTPRPQGDGTLVYEEHPLTGSIPAGEMILGRIIVEAERDASYVMVEEPLPSGAEITSQDPQQLTGEERQRYGWGGGWTHQTVRDDRITFFSTFLPQGSHEFLYLMRPEIPGELAIAPTHGEEMYSPEQTFGQSRSDRLSVTGE